MTNADPFTIMPAPESAVGYHSVADEADIDAYFERIGFAGSIAPTLETLGLLQQMHVATIPFENLSPLMGVPVRLELANLQQKLLFDRRGGFCLEHNLLFRAVLESLDYSARMLGARVHGSAPGEDGLPPRTHVLVLVEINGIPYIADTGFGRQSPTAPLRLRADSEQETPHGLYRLLGGDPVWQLEAQIRGEWTSLYTFDLSELGPDDFTAMNDRVAVNGYFDQNIIASKADKGRRLALLNLRLNTHHVGGETETRTLVDLAGVKDVLTTVFGIALPADERLDPALQRVIDRELAAGAA